MNPFSHDAQLLRAPRFRVQLRYLSAYSSPIHLGVARAAKELGWVLEWLPCLAHSIPYQEEPDGILLVGPKDPCPARDYACPVVALYPGETVRDGTPVVEMDWEHAGACAAEHLLSLRLPQLVFWQRSDNSTDEEALKGAFFATCRAAGVEPQLWNNSHISVEELERDRRFREKMIAGLPERCGVMTGDDRLAGILIDDLLAHGRKIPEEIAVMGAENIDYIQALSPVPISTIEMDRQRVGYLAARALDAYMRDPAHPPPSKVVPCGRLIERESTCTIEGVSPEVREAVLLIRREFASRLTVREIARRCRVSTTGLQQKYREETGTTIARTLRERRLAEASALLRETNLKLEAVALETGFGTIKNLWRLFKQEYGVTPGEWRKGESGSAES